MSCLGTFPDLLYPPPSTYIITPGDVVLMTGSGANAMRVRCAEPRRAVPLGSVFQACLLRPMKRPNTGESEWRPNIRRRKKQRRKKHGSVRIVVGSGTPWGQ